MKQKIKTEHYTSPDVEVIEAKARQVICTSGTINDMSRDNSKSLDW